MADMIGFKAAQALYDAMTPPEDGPCECLDCDGRGQKPDPTDPEGDYVECTTCDGWGHLDANGEPYDKDQAERDACEAADRARDERLTRDDT